MTEPRVARAVIPAEYGVKKSNKYVPWSHVEERLTRERVYWIVAVHDDGRPHVRPIDGLYVDGAIYVGGSPKTRWVRLVKRHPQVTVHLDGPTEILVWEGEAEILMGVEDALADRLAAASKAKYPEYGTTAEDYRNGVIAIRPRKVIAWTDFATDPTRFTFEPDT